MARKDSLLHAQDALSITVRVCFLSKALREALYFIHVLSLSFLTSFFISLSRALSLALAGSVGLRWQRLRRSQALTTDVLRLSHKLDKIDTLLQQSQVTRTTRCLLDVSLPC